MSRVFAATMPSFETSPGCMGERGFRENAPVASSTRSGEGTERP